MSPIRRPRKPPKPIAISPSSLPGGTVGAPYSQPITATGGSPPYRYSFSGWLPPGLSLATGGVISGIPTAAGISSFAISVADKKSAYVSQSYTVEIVETVAPEPPSSIPVSRGHQAKIFERKHMPVSVFGRKYVPYSAAPTYTGPADAVSQTPLAFWGLRGMSAAYSTGSNDGVVVQDSGAGNITHIKILSSGAIDVATLNTYIGAHTTAYINAFTDQVGSNTLSQTAGGPPTVVTSGLAGLSSPNAAAVYFSVANDQVYLSTNPLSQSQPFTVAFVYRATSAAAQGTIWCQGPGGTAGVFEGNFSTTTPQLQTGDNALGFNSGTLVNNTWYSAICVFGGAAANASSMLVNGASTTGTLSGYAITSNATLNIGFSAGGQFTGDIIEVGIWAGAMSAPNQTALQSNQRTYWGF